MDRPTAAIAIGYAKKYWKRFIVVSARDKFKAILSPDSDWKHLLILFLTLVVIFVFVSGYLYLDISSANVEAKQPALSPQAIATQKIQNAVAAITKAENNFDDIVSKKPDIADPSR